MDYISDTLIHNESEFKQITREPGFPEERRGGILLSFPSARAEAAVCSCAPGGEVICGRDDE